MSDPPNRAPGAPDATAQPVAVQPITAPMNARATQMSASVVPSTLESPHDAAAAGGGATERSGSPFVSEEISGMLLAQEPAARERPAQEHGAHAPAETSRRVAPATLASPLVPMPPADGASAALPPLPAVIDVGAPAHAFVAKSSHAPPPAPYPAPAPAQAHPHAHAFGHGHAHGGAPAAPGRSPTSPMTILVVVGAVVAALAVAVVVLAFGFLAARRAHSTATPPARPAAAADDPAQPRPAGTATEAPRPARK